MAVVYNKGQGEFVNPYHFIPLEESVAPCFKFADFMDNAYEYTEGQSLHTGWIECEVETQSPLFVPNTSNKDSFGMQAQGNEVNSYDFFSYKDLSAVSPAGAPCTPAIPGSSIRGVIRSAFEIVTNSCMSTIDHDHLLFKRFTKPYAKAGRIYKDGDEWKLQPCEPANGAEPGCYKFLGEIGIRGKRSRKNFKPNSEPPLSLSDTDLDRLKVLIETYRDDRLNQKIGRRPSDHHGYSHIDLKNLQDAIVFYEEKDGKLYLSPAQIGKEVFHNRLTAMVKNYKPCECLDALCPACLLFGIAGRKDALASRLRFSDARISDANVDLAGIFHEPGILPELASPKPSATEFYLLKQDPKHELWTYDYAGWWKPSQSQRGRAKSFDFVYDSSYRPEVMGRKMYWHKRCDKPPYIEQESASDRNVGIRPLKKGVKFLFRIHFNRIYDIEIRQLIWTLSNGLSEKHGHKLGMGKPVGLGSVTMKANKVMVRRLALGGGTFYRLEDATNVFLAQVDDSALLCNANTLGAFKRMTSLSPGVGEIRYPVNENERAPNPDAAFHWFKANKGKTIMYPKTDQNLDASKLRDGSPALKKYRVVN